MSQAHAAVSTAPQAQNIFGRPLAIFGVPVDRKTIFSDDKGNYKPRIEKRQRKLIVKTTFIKFFLRPDERILCLTTGYSPITALEQLLTGLAFLIFKKAILIFTDKRILHIPTRFDHSSFSAISQISYNDCTDIRLKGRNLTVSYKNGQIEQFQYLGRKERKKIKSILSNLTLSPETPAHYGQRVHLCPSCTSVLDTNSTLCPSCKLNFKSVFQAKVRSYLFPGGGYLYSRHKIVGALVGLAEIAALSIVIYTWVSFREGMVDNLQFAALILSALLGEKLIAAYHVQHLIDNRIPERTDFAMRKL